MRARRDVGGDAAADHVERGRDLVAAVAQLVEQGDAALAEKLGEGGRAVFDRFGERVATAVERFGEGRDAAVDDLRKFLRAVLERAGDGTRAIFQRDVEAAGAVVEGAEQVAGTLVDQGHEGLGALAESAVERIARGLERLGEVAAGFDDGARDALADHVEVEHKAGVALGDRFADALCVGDHRFALAGQFLDQRAHARFIVGVGAFERGDLVVDHHFELAGAREGALEAVAQGVHLTAHGLADRGDLFGRGGFGLGEADRGMRDGGGRVAQILGAADQRRDGEEGKDRDDRERDQADEVARAPEGRIADLAAIADDADAQDRHDPDDRNDDGDEAWRRVRARLQAVENARALEAVVIGDRTRHGRLLVGDAGAFGTRAGAGPLGLHGWRLRFVAQIGSRLGAVAKHGVFESVLNRGECEGCGIFLGARFLRHTLTTLTSAVCD